MEVVICRTRMVMPYFHLITFVNNKQYGESEMSQVVVFVYIFAFNFHLLFLIWKTLEHDKPFLQLSIPCLFPLILILCSFLYFSIFVISGWTILKSKLTVDLITTLSPCV